MAISSTTNYSGIAPAMVFATSDQDIFNRTHIANIATTFEAHDHTLNKGLAVGRLNVTNALINQGDIFINGADFTFRDNQGSPANHTLVYLDRSNAWTGTNDFSGQTGVHSFKIPVLSAQNPTQNGAVIYDSSTNTYKAGVNGTTVTLLSSGGGALGVTSGGTGVTSIPANGVMLGEGTSAINTANPSTSGYPITSNGVGADPSFQQLGTAGIANGAITDPLIAAGTITGDKIAAATITGSNIASGTITSGNLAAGALALDNHVVGLSGSGSHDTWIVAGTVSGLTTNATYLVTMGCEVTTFGNTTGVVNIGLAAGAGTPSVSYGVAITSGGNSSGAITYLIATGAQTTITGQVEGTLQGSVTAVAGFMTAVKVG